ncbi:MAG: ArnT family glycosyltransferase [Mangrovibacterium sp.]
MFERNKFSLIAIVALLLALAAYYFGLFIDLTGDAGKYAAIARHVAESGDYINLKIHGDAYDQKPPLLFWLAALGFKIGGLNNVSFKIFAVLYGFLGIFFTYKLGQSLYNKRTGQLAASMLFFSQFYFLYCMDIHTDLLLQTNVALAIWQLSEYLKRRKALNFILAFTGIGLAMMSKGPIGGAVPAFALGAHLLLKRDFKQLFHPKWLIGIALCLLVALPAFLGLVNQFGWEGLRFFFWTNNMGRISGEYVGNNTDYLFYIHNLLYLYAPWSLLLFASIFFEFKAIVTNPLKLQEHFLLGGIWIYFIIISMAKAKSPNYIFILVPLLSVLTAKWTDHFLNKPESNGFKTIRLFQGISFGLTAMFLLALIIYLFPSGNPLYWALLIVVAAACVFIYLQKGFTTEKLLLPSILLIALTNLYLNRLVFPYTFSFQSSVKTARLFNEQAGADEQLYNYLYDQYELFFYGKANATQIKDKSQLLETLQRPGSWIYTTPAGLDSIRQTGIAAENIMPLKNKNMNRTGIKFIIPQLRESSLDTMYLVRTN